MAGGTVGHPCHQEGDCNKRSLKDLIKQAVQCANLNEEWTNGKDPSHGDGRYYHQTRKC